MPKKHRNRYDKITTGGHSTTVEGLMKFLGTIEDWPEIRAIRIGPIASRNRVGRSNKRLVQSPDGVRPAHDHKRPKGGGGFSFKATRWAMIGELVTGIKCDASYGRHMQQVVLTSHDLLALKTRLIQEGYCEGW